MTGFPPRVRRALLLRSFFVQGSWNYQTLIGTGFAFLLLPALRQVFRNDPAALREAVARHAAIFNSHPYLAGIAAGAVARLEAEGAAPELIGRLKDALRGSLGALGDQLVWLAWRPATALLAIAFLLAGAPWWVAVLLFLVVYNTLHLWMRTWALAVGLRGGVEVGQLLRQSPLKQMASRAGDGGALLVGFCTVVAIHEGAAELLEMGIFAAAAAAGFALGPRVRGAVWIVLGLTWVAGMMIGAPWSSRF